MNILFVTSYPLEYNSSANIRNWGLIEGLLANGHKISTLSPYPTDRELFNGKLLSDYFEKRYWVGSMTQNQGDPRDVLPPNKTKARIKSIAFKLFNYLSVYDRRSLLVSKINVTIIDKKFDVVISSSDPKSSHLFAHKIIRKSPSITKTWIQYWGDPFSNDISFKRLFGNYFVEKEEKKLIRLADKVIYVSPFTANAIKGKYPQYKNKIHFLPIPYCSSNSVDNNGSYELGLIGYFGDYNSTNRNIMPLYKSIRDLGYKANIIGNSDITLEPTELINISNRIPSDQLAGVIKKTHVFVCVCNLHGTQIPGKVYHYVNSGKPIVIVLDGENKAGLINYFESFNRFYICDNTVDSISSCLKRVVNDNKSFGIPDTLNPVKIAEAFINI